MVDPELVPCDAYKFNNSQRISALVDLPLPGMPAMAIMNGPDVVWLSFCWSISKAMPRSHEMSNFERNALCCIASSAASICCFVSGDNGACCSLFGMTEGACDVVVVVFSAAADVDTVDVVNNFEEGFRGMESASVVIANTATAASVMVVLFGLVILFCYFLGTVVKVTKRIYGTMMVYVLQIIVSALD